MKNYNEIVSALRELARDGLRLNFIASVRSKIYSVTSDRNNAEKEYDESIAFHKKNMAIAEFKKSQIADEDPEKEEKVKSQDENIAYAIKALEAIDVAKPKCLEAYDTKLVELQDKITRMTAGEIKVDKAELDASTKALIAEVVKNTAEGLVIEEVEEVEAQ